MSEEQQAAFSIEKIYVKDLSVESPNSPQAFLQPESPEIEVQLQTAANAVTARPARRILAVIVPTPRLTDRAPRYLPTHPEPRRLADPHLDRVRRARPLVHVGEWTSWMPESTRTAEPDR